MSGELVDLRALSVFREVATMRSMTVAAAKLRLTQSAVSQSVRRLETDLGFILIEKSQRPLTLTKVGAALLEAADALLREAANLPHRLAEAAHGRAREIRIGLVDSFASTAGPILTRSLLQSAERVVVWSGLSGELGAALVQSQVDIVITSDPMADLDGLVRQELMKEQFILVLPKAQLAQLEHHSLEALAAEMPMVRFSARSQTGLQVERHLRRLNIPAARYVEVDGSDTLFGMIAAGVGWAIATPLCLLQGIAHADGVANRPLPPPGFNRVLSVVCRVGGPAEFAASVSRIAIDALRDYCLQRLQRLDPVLVTQIRIVGTGSGPDPGPGSR